MVQLEIGRGGQAVPTNLSVLSRASSPNDKVPRNWRVGHHCCLCRTMTCRTCAKITLRGRGGDTDNYTVLAGGPSRCRVLLLLHSLFASCGAPLSVFLRTSPAVSEEALSSFSPLFSSRRRAASALNITVGGSCAAAVRLWEVPPS